MSKLSAYPIIKCLIAILACYFVLLHLYISVTRLAYPFELNIIEGGMLLQVQRLVNEQALYVEPSLDFIPFIYTPLYTWVASQTAQFFGTGFLNLRILSLLCSLLTSLAAGLIVLKHSKSRTSALIAAGLYFSIAPLVEFSLDQGRVDSMLMCFVAWGILMADSLSIKLSVILSSLLFSAAFFTKQVAFFPFAFVFIGLNPKLNRHAIFFATLVMLFCVTLVLTLNSLSSGWFWYYCFELPSKHDVQVQHYWHFWLVDILQNFPVSSLLVLVFALTPIFRKANTSYSYLMWVTLGLLLESWFSRLHAGGSENVLIPAYFALLITSIILASGIKNVRIALFVWICIFLQSIPNLYIPSKFIPNSSDIDGGLKLVSKITNFSGPVLFLSHPYLLSYAGKSTHAHIWALHDVLRADQEGAERINQEIAESLSKQAFSAVIVDDDKYMQQIEASYVRESKTPLYSEEKPFFGLGPSLPMYIYSAKK